MQGGDPEAPDARLEEERQYASAIPHVHHWLEHDPLDERAYQWLIRLQALAGDRAAALQAFRQCAEVLRRELATEPSEETRRAYERLREREPPTAARRSRARRPTSRPPGGSPGGVGPLADRMAATAPEGRFVSP